MNKKFFLITFILLITISQSQQEENEENSYLKSSVRQQPQNAPSSQRRRPKTDVANQSNLNAFRRGKNEPFEGEDDEELTKSQEENLIGSKKDQEEEDLVRTITTWHRKNKKIQVPFLMDTNAKFSKKDKKTIKKQMREIAKKLKINFKNRQNEFYYLKISSLSQCIEILMRKQEQQQFSEILVCLNDVTEITNELNRAITFGLEINKKLKEETLESSEEEGDEGNEGENENDEEYNDEEEGGDESDENDESDE